MHRNEHRKLKKMKKQRNIFQTKGQGKIPETDLNKIKISDLPDKGAQNNDHKGAHQRQENNA